MNASIAELLKARIADAFPQVDKLAGMVRALERDVEGGTFRFPVGILVEDALSCDDSEQRDMIPDAKYAAIVYFEDGGITSERSRTRGIAFTSRLRLICWVNTTKFGGDPFTADKLAQNFSTTLKRGPYNTGPFIGVRHGISGQPIRGFGLFGQYNYPQSARQYLAPPYDAFGLDLITEFRIKAGCEDQIPTGDADCWTPPTTARRRRPRDFSCEELLDPDTGLTDEQKGCVGAAPCLDSTVLRDGVPYGTVSPGDTIDVPSDCPDPTVCVGVDIFDADGNFLIHLNDGDSFTLPMTYLWYDDEGAALADTTTTPTEQQEVRLRSNKRAYPGDGTSKVNELIEAKVFYLPVKYEDKLLKVNTEDIDYDHEIQVNEL
jgi:hypothetical protein